MNSLQPEITDTKVLADSMMGIARIQEEIRVLQAQQGDEEAFGWLMDQYDRKLVY